MDGIDKKLAFHRGKGFPAAAKVMGLIGIRLYRKHWEQMNRYLVWHAACLWANQEPHRPVIVTSAPYPHLKDIEGAIRNNELAGKRVHPQEESEGWYEVERDDLIKWINERGYSPRPKFLFPNG
jgi:hypothetical protein